MISHATRNLVVAAAAIATGFAATAARAEGDHVGETQQCINQSFIDKTPVIDDKTILVEMKGGGYKRIDIAGTCFDLKMQGGFSHTASSTDQFCRSDTLSVVQVGSICKIDKIVTIDANEAKTLLARK